MPEEARKNDPWIAIGLEAQFPAASVHPVVANGEALAVWRDESGQLHAWEDRCPHRGMRLSFGFVRDGMLTCLYHGWRYGADASCRHIPAHPDLEPPKTICATAHASAISHGFAFTAPEGTEAMTASAPDQRWFPVRSMFVPLTADRVWQHMTSEQARLGGAALTLEHGLLIGEVGEGDKLALAIQPVESEKTGLHLSTTMANPESRVSLARNLLRLRNDLERLCGRGA